MTFPEWLREFRRLTMGQDNVADTIVEALNLFGKHLLEKEAQ